MEKRYAWGFVACPMMSAAALARMCAAPIDTLLTRFGSQMHAPGPAGSWAHRARLPLSNQDSARADIAPKSAGTPTTTRATRYSKGKRLWDVGSIITSRMTAAVRPTVNPNMMANGIKRPRARDVYQACGVCGARARTVSSEIEDECANGDEREHPPKETRGVAGEPIVVVIRKRIPKREQVEGRADGQSPPAPSLQRWLSWQAPDPKFGHFDLWSEIPENKFGRPNGRSAHSDFFAMAITDKAIAADPAIYWGASAYHRRREGRRADDAPAIPRYCADACCRSPGARRPHCKRFVLLSAGVLLSLLFSRSA